MRGSRVRLCAVQAKLAHRDDLFDSAHVKGLLSDTRSSALSEAGGSGAPSPALGPTAGFSISGYTMA
jgi:hypothetical protein